MGDCFWIRFMMMKSLQNIGLVVLLLAEEEKRKEKEKKTTKNNMLRSIMASKQGKKVFTTIFLRSF